MDVIIFFYLFLFKFLKSISSEPFLKFLFTSVTTSPTFNKYQSGCKLVWNICHCFCFIKSFYRSNKFYTNQEHTLASVVLLKQLFHSFYGSYIDQKHIAMHITTVQQLWENRGKNSMWLSFTHLFYLKESWTIYENSTSHDFIYSLLML